MHVQCDRCDGSCEIFITKATNIAKQKKRKKLLYMKNFYLFFLYIPHVFLKMYIHIEMRISFFFVFIALGHTFFFSLQISTVKYFLMSF